MSPKFNELITFGQNVTDNFLFSILFVKKRTFIFQFIF